MDRTREKKQRISELVEYGVKLKSSDDYKAHPYDVTWQLMRHAKGTWLVSSPVARDYAQIAVEIMRVGKVESKAS